MAFLDAGEPKIDLLFTDVVMPGPLDGFALAAVAAERRPEIKILMTSGFPGDAMRGNTALAGLALLVKPYRKADLVQAIRSALAGDNQRPLD